MTSTTKPKICRPSLTQSGLVPIVRSMNSRTFSHGSDHARLSNEDGDSSCDGGGGQQGGLIEEYEISVTAPAGLRMDGLCVSSPVLPPISMGDVNDFHGLREKIMHLAMQHGAFGDERQKIALNIMGTRCFLPDENYDIKYLPAFIACSFDSKLVGEEENANAPNKGRSASLNSYDGGKEINATTVFELVLVKEMEKLNIQSRLGVARSKLLEKKIKLVDQGRGGVVILEGEPGSGKTELIAGFVAKTLPQTSEIYITHGNPFCGHVKAFGVWGVVLQQFLDALVLRSSEREASGLAEESESDDGSEDGSDISSKDEEREGVSVSKRTAVLMDELKASFEQCGEEHSELLQHVHLLNDLCSTNAVSRSDTVFSENTTEKSNSIVKSLLLRLLKRLAAYNSSVIVFEDAMHLSHDCWDLAMAASDYVLSNSVQLGVDGAKKDSRLLLIFSLRPMSHYRSRYEAVSPDYEALVEADHLTFLKLGGMPPEEIEDIVCRKLGSKVDSISPELFQFVEERAVGNPFVAVELINTLRGVRGALEYTTRRNKKAATGKMASFAFDEATSEADNEDDVDVGASRSNGDGPRRSAMFGTRGSIMSALSGSLLERSSSAKTITDEEPSDSVEVSLSGEFDPNSMPCLNKVVSTLGARLDRLNACQQGVLKVASVIAKFYQRKFPEAYDGLTFKWSTLREVYPVVGHKDHLSKELEALDDCGILMLTGKQNDILTGVKDSTFRFSYAAMSDCIQSRMLEGQKSYLDDAVAKYEAAMEKAKRSRDIKEGREDQGDLMNEGVLQIQRRKTPGITKKFKRRVQTGGEWKSRYCELKKDALYMYKEKGDDNETQIVYLQGARAEVEKDPEVEGAFTFRIDARSYKKSGKESLSMRTFLLAADSKAAMDNWVYMIRYVIEALEAAKLSKSYLGRAGRTRSMSRRSITNDDASRLLMQKGINNLSSDFYDDPEVVEGEGDMSILVNIDDGEDFINLEAFSACNPFCILIIDDLHCRTGTPNISSVDPTWNEEFVFPIGLHQWCGSVLKIQVWNR